MKAYGWSILFHAAVGGAAAWTLAPGVPSTTQAAIHEESRPLLLALQSATRTETEVQKSKARAKASEKASLESLSDLAEESSLSPADYPAYGKTAPAAPADPQSSRYAKEVHALIEKNLTYPSKFWNNGIRGKVVIELDILSSGKLAQVELAESSGNEELDAWALESIKKIGEFQAFSAYHLPQPQIKLRLPVQFQ